MRSKADLNLIGALAHMTGVEIQVHFSAPYHGHNRCDRYFGNLKRLLRSTNPGVDWSSHLKSIPEAIEIMKSFGDPAFHHFEYMTQSPRSSDHTYVASFPTSQLLLLLGF